MNSGKRITVLLVDDHEMVRVGLRSLLSRSGQIAVVGEAGTAREAVAEAARLRPMVVLLDLRLPDGNGADVAREIKREQPDARVLVLTSYTDEALILRAIEGGADGYLLKEITGVNLAESIVRVAQGGMVLDPLVARRLMKRPEAVAASGDAMADLPDVEREILRMVALGKTNKEIAAVLDFAETTVRNYLSRIFQKIGVANRAEAAAWFVQRQPK
ncbi:MAG: response regulator transcription factor [Verrucomicrobia bacterium]|nr:MAG: response regulator transcription factor [Verrucomicrobiota bacterium]